VKLPVDEDGETTNIQFLISLPAFLEVLQIFGAADAAARQAKADSDPYRSNLRNYRPDAFSHQTLGMPGTCSLIYNQVGESFRIELDEAGVSTTCNLTTYMAESLDDIPFDLENVSFKIIMLSRWLLDSLGEIAPTSPERLTIKASRRAPYLQLSSHGPLGTSSVDFAGGRELLETLQIHGEWRQTFKFDLIKTASEAMRIAKKVSMRGDAQGVLSLQLMVELDGGGHNFLDFRFVPYATPDDEENRVEGAADEEG
jgi:cell cycle checkpoint protein